MIFKQDFEVESDIYKKPLDDDLFVNMDDIIGAKEEEKKNKSQSTRFSLFKGRPDRIIPSVKKNIFTNASPKKFGNRKEQVEEDIKTLELELENLILKDKTMLKHKNIKLDEDNEILFADFIKRELKKLGYENYEVKGQKFFPKTAGQQEYLKALRESSVVIATGPAGTGKTFMAVMYAYELLRTNQIKRIVITRPIVEAGESIGFLPGDMRMKVDPYLMPLYDSFHILMGKEKTEALITKGVIEIAPLAYMRGRTFNDAFVILDEAQNTTQNQIKMFLTRLGFNSKMVITGDISQIDLKMNQQSALIQALHVLKNVEQIKKIRLTVDDIVRNPLVNEIVKAYEHFDANSGSLFNSRRNR
uniref:PhoH-like protein n=1 Tax=Biomphalaria glabrata TaxID=6526 RepID=A0A2C9L8S5_BIOGL